MAKKATRKLRAPRKAASAKAAKSAPTKGSGRIAGVNKSAKIRELKHQRPELTASQIQKALADEGLAVSLPGVYQALRANGVKKMTGVKRKGKKVAAQDNGAVSRFIQAVGELGIAGSKSLLESIEKIMHLRNR